MVHSEILLMFNRLIECLHQHLSMTLILSSTEVLQESHGVYRRSFLTKINQSKGSWVTGIQSNVPPMLVVTVSVLFVTIAELIRRRRDHDDIPLRLTSISVTGVKIFADKNR
jgi:hypothetical protein